MRPYNTVSAQVKGEAAEIGLPEPVKRMYRPAVATDALHSKSALVRERWMRGMQTYYYEICGEAVRGVVAHRCEVDRAREVIPTFAP